MKCLSIESRIITCSSVSAAVDSLLLALSRIRRCESLFALLFVMESKYSAGLCFYRVAVVSLFKFTLSALPLPSQSPGSCCSISHSIADEGGAWKASWKANRPFCSRVMKERRVVMKERAIPGPCNCCPRGPRIQYYSMGLAIWTDCIPKRDIYIYIYTNIQFRHSTPRLHASR